MRHALRATAMATYSRDQLEHEDVDNDGFNFLTCALCEGTNLTCSDAPIKHADECPLADPRTLAVDMRPLTAPRDDVCDRCPRRESMALCPAWRWSEYTHEDLQVMCVTYNMDSRGR